MSYARFARTSFINMLGTLDHLVGMAVQAKMTDEVLAEKFTEDMFPLELQFRVALNQVLLAINQVAGRAVSLEESTYQSLAQIRDRIAVVRAHVEGATTDQWVQPDVAVDLTLPNGVRFLMTADEDIRDWIMPNFYFHVTMAYALLRRAGLAIGKMDFLQHMASHKLPTHSNPLTTAMPASA